MRRPGAVAIQRHGTEEPDVQDVPHRTFSNPTMTTPLLILASLALIAVLVIAAGTIRRQRAAIALSTSALRIAAGSPTTVEARDDPVGCGEAHPVDSGPSPAAPAEILHRLYAVAFEEATIADTGVAARAGHAGVVAAATAILARIETQPRYTPRRPQLLPQLMRAVNDADASVRTMANIIAQDPTLAGNLLRITNSPLYRVQSKPVENIERAVTLVGTEGIRLIIAAALVQPVMDVGDSVFGRFPSIIWEHTLLSAAAAADHSRLVEHGDAFAAQLLGLLQGLGSIIVVQVVRDEYARQPGLTPDASVAAALLDAWASPTARQIAASWGLSDRIGQALDDQLLAGAPGALSSLGRSLRYGRSVGALALLCSLGTIDEAEALTTMAGIDDHGPTTAGIWKRIRSSGDVD